MTQEQSRDTIAVSLRGVTFSYGALPVIENADLSIHAGEFVRIIGPNGGGKTTLLKLVLGLLQPDAGEVSVFGAPPHRCRYRIGYSPQHPHYDSQFPITVIDVVLMARLERRWGGRYTSADKQAAFDALDELGVADLASRSFDALSGGERQRVLVARAIASDPAILLLDEPTANVDMAAGNKLLEILQSLNERMTILMVSHDLGFVSQAVKSVVCVNRQVVIHPTSDITGEKIIDIYGADLRMVRHDHLETKSSISQGCAEEGHIYD